jgi:hypothetical protein
MMDDLMVVDVRVDVLATFRHSGAAASARPEATGGNAACTPVRFRWKNRDITITEIGMVHPTQHGSKMIHMFDVTDGSSDYRLAFDAEILTWRLKYVADRQF